MKKVSLILMVMFIILAGSSFQPSAAQEKTKEEKEKELKALKEIDEQKKAFVDQMKSQDEITRALEISKEAIDKALKEANWKVEEGTRYNDFLKSFRGDRSFQIGEPFVITPGFESFYGRGFGGDAERTTWEFSRAVRESTFSKNYSFDVEKSAKSVIMSVNGDCKSGEIRVVISMPGGKTYSDILIDEFGNLNWRKSFTISEKENQDKTGEWVFKISAKNATGQFRISFQTY